MPDINLQLLPETRKKIEVHARGENTYLTMSIVFVVVVVGIYLGVHFYRTSIVAKINSVDGDLNASEQKRDKSTEEKLLTLYKKLNVTSPLLGSHLYWSDGLVKIEKLVQPQVQFKTLTAQVYDKKIVMKAEAGSYNIVAHQIAAFLSESAFTDVTLNKVLSLPTGRVEFTMQVDFDPDKFLVRKP